MTRKFKFSVDEYYHVYNRGVDKRIIFLNKGDKLRFQALLYLCNSDKIVHVSELSDQYSGDQVYQVDRGSPLVDIGAYCLMNNHFHLLLRERIEGGISLFMQKLATAYTMYFNILYDRTGSLFQGTFKAVHVQNDVHLKYLFAYIHLNIRDMFPRGGLGALIKYEFSSLPDYLDTDAGVASRIISRSRFPKYFRNSREILVELNDWLEIGQEPNFKVKP